MRRFLHHLLLVVLWLDMAVAQAAPRTYRQAQAIARHQFSLWEESPTRFSCIANGGHNDESFSPYYIFQQRDGKGFVVVGGDDRLPDIIGYSRRGTYDERRQPEALRCLMQAYAALLTAADRGDSTAIRWLTHAQGEPKSRPLAVVEPLLGDIRWNQRVPYNNACPLYSEQMRSITGCVATAMAQIMAMYRYPACLQKDIPAYTTDRYGLTVAGEQAGTQYDWDSMLDTYAEGYTERQAGAVARLMLHCGKSVKMNYGPSSSAQIQTSVFSTYFGYDEGELRNVELDALTVKERNRLLQEELIKGRPVLYTALSTTMGGHAFVCDGVDADGYYHINWGWGGDCDGYFDAEFLNPYSPAHAPSADSYNIMVKTVMGIMPKGHEIKSGLRVMNPSQTCADLDNDFRQYNCTVTNFSNYPRYLTVAVHGQDGGWVPVSSRRLKVPGYARDFQVVGLPLDAMPALKPDELCTVYAVWSRDGENGWQDCIDGIDNALEIGADVPKDSVVEVTLQKAELLHTTDKAQARMGESGPDVYVPYVDDAQVAVRYTLVGHQRRDCRTRLSATFSNALTGETLGQTVVPVVLNGQGRKTVVDCQCQLPRTQMVDCEVWLAADGVPCVFKGTSGQRLAMVDGTDSVDVADRHLMFAISGEDRKAVEVASASLMVYNNNRTDSLQPFEGSLAYSLVNRSLVDRQFAVAVNRQGKTVPLVDGQGIPLETTVKAGGATQQVEDWHFKDVLPAGSYDLLPVWRRKDSQDWQVCTGYEQHPVKLVVTADSLHFAPGSQVLEVQSMTDLRLSADSTACAWGNRKVWLPVVHSERGQVKIVLKDKGDPRYDLPYLDVYDMASGARLSRAKTKFNFMSYQSFSYEYKCPAGTSFGCILSNAAMKDVHVIVSCPARKLVPADGGKPVCLGGQWTAGYMAGAFYDKEKNVWFEVSGNHANILRLGAGWRGGFDISTVNFDGRTLEVGGIADSLFYASNVPYVILPEMIRPVRLEAIARRLA